MATGSGASYAIEIAAQMSGGEQTNAQLDDLTSKLMGGGKGADAFNAAIVEVSNKLTAVKAAQAAAAQALAEGESKFNELEKAATAASKALEKAGLQSKGSVDASLAIKAREANAALAAQTETVRKLEAAMKHADAATEKETQTLANLKKISGHVDKSFSQNAERLGKVQGALNALPGPLGRVASGALGAQKGFGELSGAVGSANASLLVGVAGTAAIAAAIAVVTAAAIAGAIAIARWAVSLADANRGAQLSAQAMEAMHPELIALRGTIASVGNETGMHADELQELAGKLKEAKVAAADMPAALRAAALAETALGQGGSADFIADIKAGKVAVGDLARETQAKLGGIVAQQMRGLDAQSARFSKNLSDTFGGLNIDPVLDGLERLVGLFDQNTAAGQTMKFLFESVFQPLIDSVDTAAVYVEGFVLGFLIGLTKLYIALKPAIKYFADLFGFNDPQTYDMLGAVQKAGEYLVPVIVAIGLAFGAAAAVVGVLVAGALSLIAVFVGLPAVLAGVGVAIVVGLIAAVTAAIDWVRGIDFAQIGIDILAGMASGIRGSSGELWDAIKGAVGGAITAAKKALGIASPSKVFAGIGDNTVAGFTDSVDDGAVDAADSVANMVAPPALDTGAGSRLATLGAGMAANANAAAADGGQDAAGASKGAGTSFDFKGATFIFNGVEGAEDAEARFGEMLTRFVEGDAEQAGKGGRAA